VYFDARVERSPLLFFASLFDIGSCDVAILYFLPWA